LHNVLGQDTAGLASVTSYRWWTHADQPVVLLRLHPHALQQIRLLQIASSGLVRAYLICRHSSFNGDN